MDTIFGRGDGTALTDMLHTTNSIDNSQFEPNDSNTLQESAAEVRYHYLPSALCVHQI